MQKVNAYLRSRMSAKNLVVVRLDIPTTFFPLFVLGVGRRIFGLTELRLVCDNIDVVKKRGNGTVEIPLEHAWLGN